jgi:hypothetical protein
MGAQEFAAAVELGRGWSTGEAVAVALGQAYEVSLFS